MTGERAIKILEWIYWELASIENFPEMTTLEQNIYDKLHPEFGPLSAAIEANSMKELPPEVRSSPEAMQRVAQGIEALKASGKEGP